MRGNRNSQHADFPECIKSGVLEDVQRCLLMNGKLLEEKFGPYSETALHLAVGHRRVDIVNWLLQLNVNIHATDCFSRTALHTATCTAKTDKTDEKEENNIIELILDCEGVNVNARDWCGNTPVKLAAERGKSVAVKLLLEKAADITIADKSDNTTLHVAAEKGHTKVLELLLTTLEANNNTGIIGKQNKDNKDTPLHLAVTSKCTQCVALLLNAGAASTIDVENKQGQTATDLAKEHGKEEIMALLKNPQKAKEFLPEKPKSVNSISLLGRGGSVESDSSAISLGTLLQSFPSTKIQLNANQVVLNQQITTANITGGNAAVGPGAVVNVQDSTAVVPQQSGPPGESNFDVTVTGGNACVGDRPMINVAPGTPGTPSTAGSRDGPLFPGPQENNDTSSGLPTENPSSFGATELLPHPSQEECPVQEKSTASLPFSVPEQKPAQNVDGLISSSHMSNHPRTEGSAPGRSSTGERVAGRIGCSNDIGTVDNAAMGTVASVRDGTAQEAIAPLDAVAIVQDSTTVSNFGKALSGVTSHKPDEASKQTGQRNIRSITSRNSSPMTRAVPNAAQGRLWQEVNPPNDMCDFDPLCGAPPESQLKVSGYGDVAPHRVPLAKSSGTSLSLLVRTPEEPKLAVEPSINVSQSIASSKVTDRPPLASPRCGSSSSLPCAPSPCSKESPHRKAQHSREDAIPDSALPAGAAANANQSVGTDCKKEDSFPGNHHGDNPVATSQPNVSSGAQSLADGNSTTILIDDDPENDREGHKKCKLRCRLL